LFLCHEQDTSFRNTNYFWCEHLKWK